MPVEERLFSLVLALLATESGLTKNEILSTVQGYRQRYKPGGDNANLERQFERDKDDIRDLGVPLETIDSPGDAGNNQTLRYRIPRGAYELPHDISFSSHETTLLNLAAMVWREGSLSGESRRALLKLRSLGVTAEEPIIGYAPRLRLRDPRIMPFMIYGFASGSVQAATGQALGFLIIDSVGGTPAEAAKAVGIAFMVGAGATLLAQWGLIGMLRMTASSLMRWGAGLAAAGCLGIALAHDYSGILAAFALTSLGYGFARPGFVAGASLTVSEDEQGAVAGAVTAVNGACFIVAPTIGIGLYEIGGAYPYLLGAAAQVLLLGYALFSPVLRRELGAAPAD